MSASQIDPEKIVESLMRQIAAQAQQIAMLQAIVEQAMVSESPAEEEAATE